MSGIVVPEGKRIWLTWEVQRRNRSMSSVLGATLFELTSSRTRMLRYIVLAFRTLIIIRQERPQIVFAQNPSIVLSFLVILLRQLFGYKCVIDAHNSGIFPLEGRYRILNALARYVTSKSDLTIVTNARLKEEVESWKAKAVVVPDPLPDFSAYELDQANKGERSESSSFFDILFVCTWAEDEPYQAVIDAARQLTDERIRIRITGKYDGRINPSDAPENIEFLGFISDSEYVKTLAKVDAVIVLTSRENCLNCGAYEAVSLGKPGLLSNTQAIKSYFYKGFVYTSGDPSSIKRSIIMLRDTRDVLGKQVEELRLEIIENSAARETVEAALF